MENLMSYPDLRELLEKLTKNLSGSIQYRGENLIKILELVAELVTDAQYNESREDEIKSELYEILSWNPSLRLSLWQFSLLYSAME